ncbi:hypothetical protein CPB97_003921 [Podila verticillata]|nr:hypothetical protein CPB97_003921 [Podila verticillata]
MEDDQTQAVYIADGPDVDESLFFTLRFSTTSTSDQRFKFKSEIGAFAVIVSVHNDKYSFMLDATESDYLILNQFKQCSISPLLGVESFVSPFLYRFIGEYEIVEHIAKSRIDTEEDYAELQFSFSVEQLPNHTSYERPFTFVMMHRLFHDPSGEDVTFVCDEVVTDKGQIRWRAPPTTQQPSTLGESANVGDSCYDALQRLSFDQSNYAMAPVIRRFGARKIILSQWPYFKDMFSSEFAEGGAGRIEIRVKDINAKTFLETLLYLYEGQLHNPPDAENIFEGDDPAKATWEALYLAADRYRIDDLRKDALDKMLGGLNQTSAVAFLFRMAFLFEELREPTVEFVARVCSAEMADKKEIYNKYKDHPQIAELVLEVFQAYQGAREV